MNNGATALLSESGNTSVGSWVGEGYALEDPDFTEMKISEGLNGGYSIIPGPADTLLLVLWGNSDPAWDVSAGNTLTLSYKPLNTPQMASLDPIDLLSGAYILDKTDLSLSGEGPFGLDLTRHYNSHLRQDDSAGLGYGWSHGNRIFLQERSSSRAALGAANTYQMAPMAVAALAAGALHFEHATAKEWAVATMVVHWLVDQMRYNAVALTIGRQTLEFIRMPDGSYVSPPGMKLELVKNPDGTFLLTKRHECLIDFDAGGKVTSIRNFSGAEKTFSYDSGKLQTVEDDFGRKLTYHWIGGRIDSVSDGTGRSVSFGYIDGDLTSFTDSESKVWTYHYDGEHRMTSLMDPEDRLIAESDYDPQDRVTHQRSMGDANREWTYTWSGFINTEQNPQCGITAYAYDKRGRCIVVTNDLQESSATLYDGQDRRTTYISPKGEQIDWYYDSNNNLFAEKDQYGDWTSFFYDAQLRLETLIDKRYKSTFFHYKPTHLLETVTDPLEHTTTYDYYPNGLLKEVIDAENKKTSYAYDDWGAVNKITYHDQKFSEFNNSPRGDPLTATDPELRIVTKTYNKRRQLHTTTLPSIPGEPVAIITNQYDDSGNLQDVTDAKNNLTSFTYNALGKNKTNTLPVLPTGGNVITNTYDLRDWNETTYNSLNHTTTSEWDGAHRLFASIDPLTRRTEFAHDANGRITETKDPLLRVTKQRWTARGQKDRDTDALNKFSESIFDANGNQTDYFDRRGKLYKYFYDDANRLEWSKTPSLKKTEMTYYDNNLVKTIKEPSTQTTTFFYNARNLVETKTDPLGSIGYAYDDSGLLETVTEGAVTIDRTYDERGRLKTFTTSDGDLIQYKYDANNNLSRITYPPDTAHPSGKQVNYTYNARNLLETVTDWNSRVTTYVYDRLGRLTDIQRPNQTALTIARDDAGQVLNMRERRNGTLFNYLHFRYDDAGQIKNRFRAPLVNSGWQQPSFAATYDDDNRLETVNGQTVVHDDDGNMTYGPITPTSGAVNLTYNSRNQLTNADGLSYTYDAEGRRRTITDASGTTRDVIDPAVRLLVRHNADTTTIWYVYGLGLLYEVDEAASTKTYHFDQIGSTIARTDDAGEVIGQAEYSAYGICFWKQGDMATPFLYNGQWGVQTDANGLLNMRARYYSPYLMRFLNADPIGFSGGSNWFAYADGNPISKKDPFGLAADEYGFWDLLRDLASGVGGSAIGDQPGMQHGGRNLPYENDQPGNRVGMLASSMGAAPIGGGPGTATAMEMRLASGTAAGEDFASAAGTTVWRQVPNTNPASAAARQGVAVPNGPVSSASLEARAIGHDIGQTAGTGLTAWSSNTSLALMRQAQIPGTIIETVAPQGSFWFNANSAAYGVESQVLIPGQVFGTVVSPTFGMSGSLIPSVLMGSQMGSASSSSRSNK